MSDPFLLVGRPYAWPSNPPETFDCWSLVKYVRSQIGLQSPLPFDDASPWCEPDNLDKAIDMARPCWRRRQKTPQDGDMAVLSPRHVGVWWAGGVLHAFQDAKAVVWTRLSVVRRVWPAAEWWCTK